MYLVMLETNGNQRFVFSSPRLRENIGASYQVTRLQEWTQDALGINHASTKWVSKSSGKVIVLADDKQRATELIREVTATAAAQVPGIDVTGVSMDLGTAQFVTAAHLKQIHIIAAQYALKRSPSDARFAQMPFLARAADSNLPASPSLTAMYGTNVIKDEDTKDKTHPHSLTSRISRYAAHTSRSRLIDSAVKSDKLGKFEGLLVRDPYELEKMLQPQDDGDDKDTHFLSKVAVIHIDGNGVGAIMSNLDSARCRIPSDVFNTEVGLPSQASADASEGTSFESDALRRFVLAISDRFETAVRTAFHSAWLAVAEVAQETNPSIKAIPVVPVILGGDDVTVITSGDYALVFTEAFLTAYEEVTSKDSLLKYLNNLDAHAEQATGPMTAGAGVAIVRRNFPFHIAYDLAEALVKEAKKIGKRTSPPRSSLSFHVLFDTTVLDATTILTSYSSFTKRPYFLNPTGQNEDIDAVHPSWPEVLGQVDKLCSYLKADDDSGSESQGTQTPAFPKTRAARIRKLLSERAVAAAGGNTQLAHDKYCQAYAEWKDAAQHYGAACDTIGSPESLFDLMELADLIPSNCFRRHSKRRSATDEDSMEAPTIPVAEDDHSEVNE